MRLLTGTPLSLELPVKAVPCIDLKAFDPVHPLLLLAALQFSSIIEQSH